MTSPVSPCSTSPQWLPTSLAIKATVPQNHSSPVSLLSYFSIHGTSLLFFEYGKHTPRQSPGHLPSAIPAFVIYVARSLTELKLLPKDGRSGFPSLRIHPNSVTLSQPFLFFNYPLLTSIYMYIRYPSQSSGISGDSIPGP